MALTIEAPRYLGMTRLPEPTERLALEVSAKGLVGLINEHLDHSQGFTRWSGASTHYGLVQEVARRWVDREAQLAKRLQALLDAGEAYQAADSPLYAFPPAAAEPPAFSRATEPRQAAPKPAAKPPAPRAKAATGRYGQTSKEAFCKLLLEGGRTDDEIFRLVQVEFGLSADKRGYVQWYRKHLQKQGQAVPPAKS